MDMQKAIARVIEGADLSRDEMHAVMTLIMNGEASAAQIGGFLIGLRMKGETVDEITAAASVMRDLSAVVDVDKTHLVDTCGTGGSGLNKFNISTASAFVAAAAGARVAKHGNRAASSSSGSADLLEQAGANIMLNPAQVAASIEQVGVGFLFAQTHHSAMKHAIGPRRELKARTLFNLLGPLTNPARAERQVLGVFDDAWVLPMAEVLKALGSVHVMVVHAQNGLDELSTAAMTHVAELKDNVITEYQLDSQALGFAKASLQEFAITNAGDSLNLVRGALDGSNQSASDIVALNAGAAIYVAGVTNTLPAGITAAKTVISSGQATEKMSQFVKFTAKLS